MANTITYAKVFQKELDKQVLEGSTSGWMEENASQVIYNGGNEIKMPTMSLQGLGSYERGLLRRRCYIFLRDFRAHTGQRQTFPYRRYRR